MQVTDKKISDTEILIEVKVSQEPLKEAKEVALVKIRSEVKIPGFRKNTAPLKLVEKNVEESYLHSKIIDSAISKSYIEAINKLKYRTLNYPKVEIKKFVPDSILEYVASTEIWPEVKLADYKSIKKTMPAVSVKKDEIEKIIDDLRQKAAKKEESKKQAKKGDEVLIDFAGKDQKGKEVPGAKGKDFPLVLGTNRFIDGFEDNLIGVSEGQEKQFDLAFPKDYFHEPLRGAKVKFNVKVNKVYNVITPSANDEFAKKIGNFTGIDELKKDIKKQLGQHKEKESLDKLKDDIVSEIIKKSKIPVPKTLQEDQEKELLNDLKRNLIYRGITFDEYLKQINQSEEEYINKVVSPKASLRVKASLAIEKIAKAEKINASDEEINQRIKFLKAQYKNPDEEGALNSEETRSSIASRLITEKTVSRLLDYATEK
ncbi:trigger factor [Candidatus Saccharibacteria bacterium CPR2]|nr:trigger factor [Candidatus Saccharibacteria bacterium CPR2]